MKKRESFFVRLLKGWGYFAVSYIMNTWFCTVMLVFAGKSLGIKLLVGIAALIIVNGLFFNYSYNAAKADRDLIKYHGEEYDKKMPLKMSLFVPMFHYVSLVILFIGKLGIITYENLFTNYLLTNIHMLPWKAMFTEESTMESLSFAGLLGFLVITLIEPAVISLTYILTLKDVDVKGFVYKKQ